MSPVWLVTILSTSLILHEPTLDDDVPLQDLVTFGHADNDGVKIHFATLGEGPLIVMLHGFPDYWYTWRHQMMALSEGYRTVAIDLRGYNRSDKPKGVQNYRMPLLVSDVAAVIRHFEEETAIVIGHDWGGAIAWNFAMNRPEMLDKLIICNLPHPGAMGRELANNKEQQDNSEYARNFQKEDAHKSLSAEGLASWVRDDTARKHYVEAFKRSDFEAMLHYYKANYPSSKGGGPAPTPAQFPKVKSPVLMIHGLEDKALLPSGLNNTWEYLEKDLTIVTVPGAGHFVQQDAAEFVTQNMLMWLERETVY